MRSTSSNKRLQNYARKTHCFLLWLLIGHNATNTAFKKRYSKEHFYRKRKRKKFGFKHCPNRLRFKLRKFDFFLLSILIMRLEIMHLHFNVNAICKNRRWEKNLDQFIVSCLFLCVISDSKAQAYQNFK